MLYARIFIFFNELTCVCNAPIFRIKSWLGYFSELFVTAAAGCRAVFWMALLDHPAVAAGTIAMVRFPQGRLALILLPQMTRFTANFLAFDIHQLAGLFIPGMVT